MAKGEWSRWSPEKEAELRELCAEGLLTASEMGNELGVTRNAVIGKIGRLGIAWVRANGVGRPRGEPSRPRRPVALRFTPQPVLVAQPMPGPDEPPPGTIHLLDLQPDHCRWPSGEGAGVMFCGQPQEEGQPYCPYHCGVAYRRVEQRRIDTPDVRAA